MKNLIFDTAQQIFTAIKRLVARIAGGSTSLQHWCSRDKVDITRIPIEPASISPKRCRSAYGA